jgi:hypothetical protein
MDQVSSEGIRTLLELRDAVQHLLSNRPSIGFEPCGILPHRQWRALIAALRADTENPQRIDPLTPCDIGDIMGGDDSE